MRTWAKGSTSAALLAVAVMSLGGTAVADTDGDGSILGGNQIDAPVNLPIDISGNSAAVLGDATAGSRGGASVDNPGRGGLSSNRTSGRRSVLGGNQVNAPITLPVNACGNAVSLVGSSDAGCTGGGSAVRNHGNGGTGRNRTNGDGSVLGGNQVIAPITAPINACGNSVAVFGDATAGCRGGASVKGNGTRTGDNTTSGRRSVLGGNQVIAPITAPVNVCGNSAGALLGSAFAGCTGGAKVKNNGGQAAKHRYTRSWQSQGNDTNGDRSVLGGNQVIAPITAPVNVCGNAVAVLGEAFAGCRGGATVQRSARDTGYNVTSGRGSVLGGNQVVAPITAPVNVCGNAAAVLGDAAAGCLGGAHVGRPQQGYGQAFDYWGAHHHGLQPGGGRGRLSGGMMPALPSVDGVKSSLGKRLGDDGKALPVGELPTGGLPVGGDLPIAKDTLGLPDLPALPGLSGTPVTPAKPAAPARPGKHGKHGKAGKPGYPMSPAKPRVGKVPTKAAEPGDLSPLSAVGPATDLVGSTPVGGAVQDAVGGLPVGLMSAEQPGGVTGMNAGALLALVLGAAFAASASLFAAARRVRFRRG